MSKNGSENHQAARDTFTELSQAAPRPPFFGRPLLWLTISFMLGIVSHRLFEGTACLRREYFALAAAVLLAASILSLKFRDRTHWSFFHVPLFLVMGMWAAFTTAPELPFAKRIEPFFDRPMTPYIAEVSAPPEYYPDKVKIPLRLIAALTDGKRVPLDIGVLLNVAGNSAGGGPSFHKPGDILIVRMTLKPFRNLKNPGSFDYVRYQAEKGFYASAYLKDETFITEAVPERGFHTASLANRAWGRIDLFRQKALYWLRGSLGPDSAAFYAALILGYQNFIDRPWRDHIQRTGLNHLLTVSGLHLGLVGLLVFWLVRLLVRGLYPRVLRRISDSRIAVGPALACAVIYAFLAGFGVPPIWRSVLMLAVCFGAAFWYRSPDSLTVLAFAALVILVFDPNSLWQISFQLTFACVIAIIAVYPRLRVMRVSRFVPWIPARKVVSQCEDAFLVSIAVNILVLPLTVFHFNGFSLAGFAANIILVPYVGFLILPWGLLSLAVFSISETLAYPFIRAGEWVLAPALYLIKWFSGFSWSYFWTGGMPLFKLFSIYAALALVFAPLSRKVRVAGLALLVVLLGGNAVRDLAAGHGGGPFLKADIIDVGQGTSTLVRFPSGEAMLVDGGGFRDDSFDIGRAVVAPFLWRLGVRRLDHVVLSHDHPDHRNGLRFILSNFDAGSFWTSGISDRQTGRGRGGEAFGLEDIAARRGIKVRSFPALVEGERIGDVRINVRHPGQKYLERRDKFSLNDMSLVIEVGFGATSLILPGDIGAEVESAIAREFEKDRCVLLVSAHHGSEYSNSAEFLDALRPFAVVFSCGYANRFGFPAPGAVRRCEERKIKTYRTDLDGAVHAVSDGKEWTIKSEK